MESNIKSHFKLFLPLIEQYKKDIISKKPQSCKKCGGLLQIKLADESSYFLELSCNCEFKRVSISIINYFSLQWLETKLFEICKNKNIEIETVESLEEFQKVKLEIGYECCRVLNELVRHKNYITLFDIKPKIIQENDDDDSSQFTNFVSLEKKIAIFFDAKEMKKAQFMSIFQTMSELLKIKNELAIKDNKFEEFEKLQKSYIDLVTSYNNSLLYLELMTILFIMQYNLYKEFKSNSIVIQNIVNCTHISINDPPSINETEFSSNENVIAKAHQITNYFQTHNLLLSNDDEHLFSNYEKIMNIHEVKIKEIVPSKTRKYGNHTVKINCVLPISYKRIIIGSSHSTIKLFNMKTMHCEMKFKGHSKGINYLCKLGEEEFLSCSDDRLIIRWGISKSICRMEFVLKIANAMNAKCKVLGHAAEVIKVLPFRESLFISCSLDKTIKVWINAEKPLEIFKVTNSEGNLVSFEILDDYRFVSASTVKKLTFWKVQDDSKQIKIFSENTVTDVECFYINSLKKLNNRILLVGGKWELTIVDINLLTVSMKIKDNDLKDITSFFIFNGGSFICVANTILYAYNIAYNKSQLIIKTKTNHLDYVSDITLLQGNNLITVSSDSTIRIWNFDIIQNDYVVC